MPVTTESTPVSNLEVVTVATPPGQSEVEWIESLLEQLVPVQVVEVHMQPSVDNQLGGSYITEAQVMQVENVSCHTSISSLDSVVHEYLKNHSNELLNNKVYNTFTELFGSINIDSMKEALPKISFYNDTIARFVEESNSKHGMTNFYAFRTPWGRSLGRNISGVLW